MAHQLGSVCWFECATTDRDAALAFYSSLFGWTAVDPPQSGDHPGIYKLLKSRGADIAGSYELAGAMLEGVPSHWTSYICVADADATAKKATSLGGSVQAGPMDVPGLGRMAFLVDPTGANISVFELGEHNGMDSDASNFGWIELHTPDPEAAEHFYSHLFGWGVKEDPSGQYTEFLLDGTSIAGMMAIADEQKDRIPANWLPYAMVEDCDRSLATAVELGARVIVPSTDIPDVGRFGVFCDPTGAHLAIIQMSEHEQS
jgi:predicted enzyme related to lactoylglutathione lyase